MKILIIEDAVDVLEELRRTVQAAFDPGEVIFAQSRDSALSSLSEEVFDLIILDRKLPTSDGALDDDVAHGEAVYEYIKEFVPGTPVRFWTAYLEDDYIAEKIESDVRRDDIWGSGKQYATVGLIPKSRFDKLIELARVVKEALEVLARIEIRQPPGFQVQLSKAERSVLKIFARRQGGTAIEVQNLTGGLSEVKVIRAVVFDGARPLAQAVAKIAEISQVDDENQRQRRVLLLPAGAATPVMGVVRAGAGATGGLFYRLADGYTASLFDALSTRPRDAAAIISQLRDCVAPWAQAATEKKARIGEYRRKFAPDSISLALRDALSSLRLEQFEAQEFSFQVCCGHGDLHCGNVLVNQENRPILIDYGEVEEHAAALDPVTLELSVLFHPQRPQCNGWPSADQAIQWCNLDAYLVGCPMPEFVRNCRKWAYDAATGNRALCAIAYCYLMRQIKYEDTNKDLINAIITGVVTEYGNT